MMNGTKVEGKGPGIVSGNLSFIGAFVHKEDAEEFFDKSILGIPLGWTAVERTIAELNGKYVVRILATQDQGELFD